MVRNTLLILVVLMTAVLYLTDGTNTVDLLESDGYVLSAWRPQIADYKDGGVWQTSSITRGRRLVQKHFDNVIETFELKLKAVSQNAAVRFTQDLKRMLEAASDYWVNRWNSTPVYLVYKPSKVDNTQYALVYRGRIPEEENPFAQPFLQPGCKAAMDNLTLLVERDHWTENAPGTGTCVETSGTRDYLVSTVSVGPYEPGQSTDDVEWYYDGYSHGSYQTLAFFLTLGSGGPPAFDVGIRFNNVAVPQGATILESYVTFEAEGDRSETDCYVKIIGEDVDSAGTFTGSDDFRDRYSAGNVTDAYVEWGSEGNVPGIPPWADTKNYNTPDLSDIIQEIVNRSGWVSGNDLVLFFLDNGSESGSNRHAVSYDGENNAPSNGDAPELYIVYTADDPDTYGRAATCEREVYVANKDNEANITNVEVYDASGPTWTSEYGTVPYYLLGDAAAGAIADGDITYFGCTTDLADSGPFAGLVRHLSDALVIAGGAEIIWEYYDGVTPWADLVVQDNTDNNTGPFTISGVNSVHWEHPSDWATANLNTLFGGAAPDVTAYWVRARVDLTSGTITGTVQQQNREVYTITWSCIEADSGQLPGDIPALCKLQLHNESDAQASPELFASRIILGARSKSRGDDFRAYINLADEQNIFGVIIGVDGDTAEFADEIEAPTGRAVWFDPNTHDDPTTWETRATVQFSGRTLNQAYYGRYHAWVRGRLLGGDVDNYIEVRLAKSMPAGSPVVISETRAFSETGGSTNPEALDMGEVAFPLSGIPYELTTDYWSGDKLLIQAREVGAMSPGHGAVFYDLILIPVDEWVAESIDPSDFINFDSSLGRDQLPRYLEVDSVTTPKRAITSVLKRERGEDHWGILEWRIIASGEFELQDNEDQQLWLFAERFPIASAGGYGTTTWLISPPYEGYSVQVWRNARYLGMRGDR